MSEAMEYLFYYHNRKADHNPYAGEYAPFHYGAVNRPSPLVRKFRQMNGADQGQASKGVDCDIPLRGLADDPAEPTPALAG